MKHKSVIEFKLIEKNLSRKVKETLKRFMINLNLY